MAKEKKAAPFKDTLMVYSCILGGLLVLGSVVPQVPWRYAAANSALTTRFSSPRAYSLFTVGNHMGQPVSWLKLRRDVCQKMKEWSQVNPITALAGMAASAVGTGGAAVGCQGWVACKEHVSLRCSGYSTIAVVGIMSMLFNVIAAISAFLVPMFCNMEAGIKDSKKKEKAAAKFNTMAATIASFLFSFLAVTGWVFMTDSVIKNFQRTSLYPYPAAYAGMYIAGAGTFFCFIGMYCGISRNRETEDKKPEVAEEQYQDPYGDANFPPGMGPPGMGMPPPAM